MNRFLLSVPLLYALLVAPVLEAAPRITSPKQQFGFNIGDDYHLANYQQLTAYWRKLARESNRMKLVPIGLTEEGRTQLMAIISSPANLERLERYRDISKRLALAEGLTDAQARSLAAGGRAVVWLDGGLHATETVGAQQLVETVYRLLSRDDAEVRRILDEVIVLCVLANPDGMDLVSDWYMRESAPEKRSYGSLPRLYQKYTGHDNNRDFYAVTQAETKNMVRVLYREWFPQIIYNHHQSGPPGTVMFMPPFRDPFNYHYDVRVINGLDAVCAAMMNRFLDENKPGVTCRSGARYSAWYSGGLRTSGYFHNAIGILTEVIGSPTPMSIPFTNPKLQLPGSDLLAPIAPQRWHMRQSIEYSFTANMATLDYAARNRTQVLWNRYAMGRDAILAGSRDSWLPSPTRVALAQEALEKRSKNTASAATNFATFFRNPSDRAPYGYVVPSSQADFATATKFINTLIENGVRVYRAASAFEMAGKSYPADSFVVPCNQAFRSQIFDAFEPQDHPDDLQYPGGPPIAPYDMAGWTLAMQMDVQFDRVFEILKGPFRECRDVQKPLPGKVAGAGGCFLRADVNNAFRAVNRLHAAGQPVHRLVSAVGEFPAGTFYLPEAPDRALADELGVTFTGGPTPPADAAKPLRPVRVGLWDRYGGSMPSGWTRWLLEQFEFPFEVVYPPRLDKGDLKKQFDVLIFVAGAISSTSTNTSSSSDKNIPPEYQGRQGRVTTKITVPKLRDFLEAGGTVLTIGSSTDLAKHLGLPVANHLVEPAKKNGEKTKSLPREKFYVAGSVLSARVNNTHPLAWGLGERVNVMFHNSPVFRLQTAGDISTVAWFDEEKPLRSGWAMGQSYLKNGLAVMEAPVGRGRLALFGPEIVFRAQSHGTFKFLFNGILNAGLDSP